MGILALFNHALNFAAPALWLAAGLALLGRLSVKKRAPGWLTLFAVNLAVGLLTLGLGLALLGSDGKMLTYSALVLCCASSQWLLLRR